MLAAKRCLQSILSTRPFIRQRLTARQRSQSCSWFGGCRGDDRVSPIGRCGSHSPDWKRAVLISRSGTTSRRHRAGNQRDATSSCYDRCPRWETIKPRAAVTLRRTLGALALPPFRAPFRVMQPTICLQLRVSGSCRRWRRVTSIEQLARPDETPLPVRHPPWGLGVSGHPTQAGGVRAIFSGPRAELARMWRLGRSWSLSRP